MKNIILWLVGRLQEPSSSAGIAAILLGSTQLANEPTTALGVILSGIVAVFAKEKGSK